MAMLLGNHSCAVWLDYKLHKGKEWKTGWKWSCSPDLGLPGVLGQGVWTLFSWNLGDTRDFLEENFVSYDLHTALSNRDLKNSGLSTEELLPHIKDSGDLQFKAGMWAPYSHQGSRPLLVFCISVLAKQAFILTVTSWSEMAAYSTRCACTAG